MLSLILICDVAMWGQYNVSTARTYPGEGGGHVATVVYHNGLNTGANGVEHVLTEGDLTIIVTVNDKPGDIPDELTITVPEGYIAIPHILRVGEEQEGSAEIFEAEAVPLG